MTSQHKPEETYLDSNVIIEICDGQQRQLKTDILRVVEFGKSVFPFSATQVSEITNNPLTKRCEDRLNFLSTISTDLYFVHSIYDYEIRTESPMSVWGTTNEVIVVPNENRLFSEIIPFEAIKSSREQLGLDPVTLNNLDGYEAVEAINQALSDSVPEGVEAPRSIREVLEITKKIIRENFTGLWNNLGTSEEHMTIGDDIRNVFALLEAFGYWPDSKDNYNKGTRFADVDHVFSASHFDIFISRDSGAKNRALAVYAILDIKTKVMHTEEYKVYVSKM